MFSVNECVEKSIFFFAIMDSICGDASDAGKLRKILICFVRREVKSRFYCEFSRELVGYLTSSYQSSLVIFKN